MTKIARTVSKKTLCATHPDYQGSRWEQYRSLHKGGSTLEDSRELERLFPRHTGESPQIYAERKKRMLYLNFAGFIVNQHASQLFTDPLKVEIEPDTRADFYQRFLEDASRRGGRQQPWPAMLMRQIIGMLVMQRAWTMLALPSSDSPFRNRDEQERAGALDAFARPLDPFSVTDWETTDDGQILWLKRHVIEVNREDFGDDNKPVHVVEVWSATERVVWRIPDDKWRRAGEDEPFEGQRLPNTYGRVPVVCMEIDHDLWLMDQLSSVARELLNKHSALAWAEYRALFPFLLYKLKDEQVTVDGEQAGGSMNNATNVIKRPIGPGYGQVLWEGESAEWVSPPSDSFSYCLDALKTRKEDMARVLYAVNLAADLSSGSQRRTAESKQLDIAVSRPFLTVLGRMAREHTRQVLDHVAALRGDRGVTFTIRGLDAVQPLDIGDLVDRAVNLETIEIPSPTFQAQWKGKLARAALGHELTDDVAQKITTELENAYAHASDPVIDAVPPHLRAGTEDEA